MRAPPPVQVTPITRGALVLAALAAALAAPAGQAAAADKICVRSDAGAPAINGVVAPGVTTGGCAADAYWGAVTPVQTMDAAMMGGGPSGYLYTAVRDQPGPANDRLFVGVDVAGDQDLSDQDVVVLMFDANNSNMWDAGDFYLRIVVTPLALPIISGTQCNQTVGAIEYFEWTGGAWVQVTNNDAVAAIAGAVVAKMAYDMDATPGDPGEIWNLELSLPINLDVNGTTYFGNSLAGQFFGMGAYLFVDAGHLQMGQTGSVEEWPSSMVDRLIGQQNMGGIPSSQPSELADASVADVCFDVNFASGTPWEINGAAAASHDHQITRTGTNVFKVTFFFDGPGVAPTPLSNGGTVKLRLKPYHAGGSGPVREVTQVVNTMSYNAFTSVTFNVDLNVGAPPGWPANINFICADLVLEGFTRDDVASNNFKNVNYNYFTTSTYAHSFVLGAVDVPGLRPGESASIMMRVVERNGMGGTGDGTMAARTPSRGARTGLLGAAGLGVLLLGMVRMGRGRGWRWRAGAAVLLALGVGSCVALDPLLEGLTPERPQWSLPNAREVGLEPVRGQPGWYSVQIPYGETREVDIRFDGGPLPYETRRVPMPVMAEGRPNVVRVPVRPGEVQTVMALGTVDVDGPQGRLPEVGAGGIVVPAQTATTGRGSPYLLRAGRYAPNEHVGALIGSFDDFETSFVVGRTASIVVPDGATTLSLATNMSQAHFPVIRGSFELVLTSTPGPRVPHHTSIQGDGTFQAPVIMPIWNALASLDVVSYYVTESRDPEGRVTGRTRNPLGEAHYSIYESHVAPQVRGTTGR
jgi:hypothetical protein